MKKILILAFIIISFNANAQQAKNSFIDKGKIEYEVTQNFHKSMMEWGAPEDFKDQVSKFIKEYYSLTFANGKSLFKFERADDKNKVPPFMNMGKEENTWYTSFDDSKIEMNKNMFGEMYNLTDTIINIKWKMSNENRIIAGYNCRKAVGIVFDSVYVFAFYSDEIISTGGPIGVTGLPGTILGLTIPRLYTSWIATKVETWDANFKGLEKAPASKGKKKTFLEMKNFISSRTEDWGKFSQSFVWNTLL